MGPFTGEFFTWDWIVSTVIVELAVVIVGVFIANVVMRWLKERKYGKWNLVVKEDQETLADHQLSAETSERILSDDTDLDIFLKGRVSVFGNVRCDLVTQMKKGDSQVIRRNDEARVMTMWLNTFCDDGKIGIQPRPPEPEDEEEPIL